MSLNLHSSSDKRGTRRVLRTLEDVVAGANVVCVKSGGGATKDKEYTVITATPQRIDFEGNGRKGFMKPVDFVQSFERRVGPIVEESVRRGLRARATSQGEHYTVGSVITLTEAEGRIYEFRDENGKKGHMERQELFSFFKYI